MAPGKKTKKRQRPLPTHSKEGVDLTLIRAMLALTPVERLLACQGLARSVMKIHAHISRT